MQKDVTSTESAMAGGSQKKAKHNPTKLSKAHQAWIHYTVAALFITGAALSRYRFASPEDTAFLQNYAGLILKIHGAVAMVMLMIFGSLVKPHFMRNWKDGRNRLSGFIMGSSLSILILSGYGLYYASDEALRNLALQTHRIIGLALPVLIVAHIFIGRKFFPKE